MLNVYNFRTGVNAQKVGGWEVGLTHIGGFHASLGFSKSALSFTSMLCTFYSDAVFYTLTSYVWTCVKMIFGKQNLTHIKSETRRPGLLPPLWGLRFTRQRIKYKKL